MPIYVYRCEKCEEEFEELQKVNDPPLKEHENCGGNVHKIPALGGFRFKGEGWGGWTRTGQGSPLLTRTKKGKNCDFYGE